MPESTVLDAVAAFKANYENSENLRAERPNALVELNDQGWEEFARKGLPIARRGNELWKYTDLRGLAKTPFSQSEACDLSREQVKKLIPQIDQGVSIVTINGRFVPELSQLPEVKGLTVKGLEQAFRELPELMRTHYGRYASPADNEFIALNSAFAHSGVCIVLEPGTELEQPIQVANISTGDETPRVSYPRALFVAQKNSSARLVETYVNTSTTTQLLVGVSELVLEEGARIAHERIQIEQDESYHIGMTRIAQGKDSSYKSFAFLVPPKIGRYDVHTALRGPGAESDIRGIYLTSGKQHQSNEIGTTHISPHCTSSQYFKGVLSGSSRAIFSGKVIVCEGALKTDASQKDLNLLLSNNAEIDTKPSLEIYADDVKCGHGATAGHIDEDTLFYIQSRGLKHQDAMALLVRGFVEEIVGGFEVPGVCEFLDQATEKTVTRLLAEADW